MDIALFKTLEVYASAIALVAGLGVGFYLFVDWIRHRKIFVLLASVGFLMLFLFKVPNVLTHFNMGFALAQFELFFIVTFSAYFWGQLLLYVGFKKSVGNQPPTKKQYLAFCVWGLAVLGFFAIFFADIQHIDVQFPIWLSTILFYIPIQVMMLVLLSEVARNKEKARAIRIGAMISLFAYLALLFSSFLYLFFLTNYSPRLWFIPAINPLISLLQASYVVLVCVGFLVAHRRLMRV